MKRLQEEWREENRKIGKKEEKKEECKEEIIKRCLEKFKSCKAVADSQISH